jgi:hypothetical protein
MCKATERSEGARKIKETTTIILFLSLFFSLKFLNILYKKS